MTLLRAGRIASVASIEELMKAVRELKASGGLPVSAAPAAVAKPAEAPKRETSPAAHSAPPQPQAVEAAKPAAPSMDRQAILDDPKLNGILKSMPGTKIVDIKEG
jgi:hypothetical protein